MGARGHAGMVVVTAVSLANPYAVKEIQVFPECSALLPVFVRIRQGDFIVEDVVERFRPVGYERSQLWKAYDGVEAEWRENVKGLAHGGGAPR